MGLTNQHTHLYNHIILEFSSKKLIIHLFLPNFRRKIMGIVTLLMIPIPHLPIILLLTTQ